MKVTAEELSLAAAVILEGLGETSDNAAKAADCMAYADMTGVVTHGTYLLKNISNRVKAGILNLPTCAEIAKDDMATAIVDGGNGLGFIAARLAMETAVKKAGEYGVGWVLIRSTNNVGCLGYYANIAVRSGMIGVAACNANAAMAPWGGREAFLGTNPISVGIPAGEENPIILDMASSLVARGKIRKASRENKQIPEGWALDGSGAPTTDPDEALKGSLLPMGGPKGSGLAMIVDIISGMLSGSKYGLDVTSFHSPDGPTGVGGICIALDISRFMDLCDFTGKVDDYVKTVKSLKTAEGHSSIYMPGEIENTKLAVSRESGIDLDATALDTINVLLRTVDSDMKLGG